MRKRILLAALLLVSLICVGFARQQAPERPHWEYKAICGRVDIAEMNKLGWESWEMAAATQDGNVTCLYFKRRS